jgi:hypothetical protein
MRILEYWNDQDFRLCSFCLTKTLVRAGLAVVPLHKVIFVRQCMVVLQQTRDHVVRYVKGLSSGGAWRPKLLLVDPVCEVFEPLCLARLTKPAREATRAKGLSYHTKLHRLSKSPNQ